MYARVTMGQVRPGAIEMGGKVWDEAAMPALREVEGFRGVTFLGDRTSNEVLVMILFESKEASDAYGESRARDRVLEIGRDFFMGFPTIKDYEVLFHSE